MGDKEFQDMQKALSRGRRKKAPKSADEEGDDAYDVAYKAISMMNGHINRMRKWELESKCREQSLSDRGKEEVLRRRLKEYYKEQQLSAAGLWNAQSPNPDYFIVIDFEATCEEKNPPGFLHEIIEFPAVLVSSSMLQIVDVFHSFVRPVHNPVLSDFCVALTGIAQSTVDEASPFPDVHRLFVKWMSRHSLGKKKSFLVVTDGHFDMGRFLLLQTMYSGIKFPGFAQRWINIRKSFATFYHHSFKGHASQSARLPNLQSMLHTLGLEFQGTPHSGLDDAKNIAAVLLTLLRDRAVLVANDKLNSRSMEECKRVQHNVGKS